MLLNDGNDTHFTSFPGEISTIDLSLSSILIGRNSKCKVISAIFSYDHWSIIIISVMEIPLNVMECTLN